MEASASPRLLIVDDDLSTTQTFAQILKLEGYDVRTAATAESGLREIQAGQPDAIILDLRMPFINGLGLLYRLRAGEPHRQTPVVIVTGDQCLDDASDLLCVSEDEVESGAVLAGIALASDS